MAASCRTWCASSLPASEPRPDALLKGRGSGLSLIHYAHELGQYPVFLLVGIQVPRRKFRSERFQANPRVFPGPSIRLSGFGLRLCALVALHRILIVAERAATFNQHQPALPRSRDA